jgi:hypothetical protein
MACKAVTLLDHAHSLALSWTLGSPIHLMSSNTDGFCFVPFTPATSDETKADLAAKIAAMHHATQAFKDTIAPLAVEANIQDPLIIIHTTILLTSIRLDVAPSWTKSSVENGLAVVALVDGASFEYIGHVHPILGCLWTGVGQVLIDELIRIRKLASKSEEDIEQETKVKNATDRLAVALKVCGADCPYICE